MAPVIIETIVKSWNDKFLECLRQPFSKSSKTTGATSSPWAVELTWSLCLALPYLSIMSLKVETSYGLEERNQGIHLIYVQN